MCTPCTGLELLSTCELCLWWLYGCLKSAALGSDAFRGWYGRGRPTTFAELRLFTEVLRAYAGFSLAPSWGGTSSRIFSQNSSQITSHAHLAVPALELTVLALDNLLAVTVSARSRERWRVGHWSGRFPPTSDRLLTISSERCGSEAALPIASGVGALLGYSSRSREERLLLQEVYDKQEEVSEKFFLFWYS